MQARRNARRIRIAIATAACASGAALAACSPATQLNVPFQPSEEFKKSLFHEPEKPLTNVPDGKSVSYDVYEIVDVTFAPDAKVASLSARATIKSSAGRETVDLVGVIREDGSASLVDLTPLPNGLHRLVGEAYCVDHKACKNIILNLFYNVAGKVHKRQFVTGELLAASESQLRDEDQGDWHDTEKAQQPGSQDPLPTLAPFKGPETNKGLVDQLVPRSETPELVQDDKVQKIQDEPTAAPQDSKATPAPAAPVPDADTSGGDDDSPPDESKVIPPENSHMRAAAQPAPAKPAPKSAAPAAKPAATPVKQPPAKPAPAPTWGERIRNWGSRLSGWLMPWRHTEQKPVVKPAPKPTASSTRPAAAAAKPTAQPAKSAAPAARSQPPRGQAQPAKPNAQSTRPSAPVAKPAARPARPATAAAKPVAQPAKPAASAPKPAAPAPKPVTPPPAPPAIARAPVRTGPAQPPAAPKQQGPVAPDALRNLPFPPAAPTSDTDADTAAEMIQEAQLAPLLNLRDGGVALRSVSNGALRNASPLPNESEGMKSIMVTPGAKWGSGILISFLENAAAYFTRQLFPGLTIGIGDIAKQRGGQYGSHQTHDNGLAADIGYIGIPRPLIDSALDSRGHIIETMPYEKTWKFLELAYKQHIVYEDEEQPALNIVFMSPAVKNGFCSWAKSTGVLDKPDNKEIMRLILRENGHYKHFHLSLKCSPHYPATCRHFNLPTPGPGCR